MTVPVGRRAGRSRALRLVILGIVVVVVLGGAAAVTVASRGARKDVQLSSLVVSPDVFARDGKLVTPWQDFGSHDDGESLFREWSGPSGALLHEEVSASGNPLTARYHYVSVNPARKYRQDFGDNLVETASVPSGTGADDAELFCGNIGRSAPGSFDGCQIWGYRARFGQYVVYLELRDVKLDRAAFTELAQRYDAAITAAVGR